MKSLTDYIYEGNIIKTDLSNFNLSDIPEDSAIDKNNVKAYDGIAFSSYKYFGDCRNTVDIDKMWDATQMTTWINTCGIVEINEVVDKLYDGDRKIPAKLLKAIDVLKKENRLNDLSEICCGMDDKQKIMFIYLSSADIHYFFDCKR